MLGVPNPCFAAGVAGADAADAARPVAAAFARARASAAAATRSLGDPTCTSRAGSGGGASDAAPISTREGSARSPFATSVALSFVTGRS